MKKEKLSFQRGALLRFVEPDNGEIARGLYIGQTDNGDLVVVPLSDATLESKGEDAFRAQCLHEGEMVEFMTAKIGQIDDPVVMWRFKAPDEVRTIELREHKRIQCTVPTTIEAVHQGQVVNGIIRDISKSGARCMLQMDHPQEKSMGVGEAVTLCCTFPGIPGEQSTPGTVTEVEEKDGELSIGIQFGEPVWWVPPYH